MLEQKGRVLAAVVCFRALLAAILGRGHSNAYGHVARHLQELRRLDSLVNDYGSLPGHEDFEAAIRSTHGRKTSFWKRIRDQLERAPSALLGSCICIIGAERSSPNQALTSGVTRIE